MPVISKTHIGLVRKNNEDSLLVREPHLIEIFEDDIVKRDCRHRDRAESASETKAIKLQNIVHKLPPTSFCITIISRGTAKCNGNWQNMIAENTKN